MPDGTEVEIVYEQPYDEKGQPILHLDFRAGSGNWVTIPVMFDSGADITFLGRDFADMLGIGADEIRKGELAQIKPADNNTVFAFRHRLWLRVPLCDKIIPIEALISAA